MKSIAVALLAALSLCASAAHGQDTKRTLLTETFAPSPDSVYTAAVALAIDRGYAEHGWVGARGVPVLLDLHQTLYVGEEQVDLYVRRSDGGALLLAESLQPAMNRTTR